MAQGTLHNVTPLQDGAEIAAACALALGETAKALKAFSFYPEGHPLRAKIIDGAYHTVAEVVKDGAVALTVQRNGFSFADRDLAMVNNPVTSALAHELFTRELQRLTLLPDLTQKEYTGFIALLATDPQRICAAGGMAAMLKAAGILGITVNEIDISAVFTKKNVGTDDDSELNGSNAGEVGDPDDGESEWTLPHEISHVEELGLDELVALMAEETDDKACRQLARQILAKGQILKLQLEFDRLFAVYLAMARQHADATRSAVQRDCALMLLQQLAQGEPTEHLLDHLEDEEFGQAESVYLILGQLGADAVDPLVARLLAPRNGSAKRPLAKALARIGAPAVPALSALLCDNRWQVVHTAVALLGEIGSRDSVKGLALTVHHDDDRVRVEAIRSLARIGGMEATTVLLDLMKHGNEAIAVQVITWLGNTRSQAALEPLLELALKRTLLGKAQQLKKAALLAIGRIGDRRALEHLIALVNRKSWLASGRSEELKLVAVKAIGKLGGKPAQVFLEELASRGGQLGRASSAALATMDKKAPRHV